MKKEVIKMLGDNIKDLRKQNKFSLRKLSKLSNVPVTTIFDAEANNTSPKISTLQKIANALNVTLGELIDNTTLSNIPELMNDTVIPIYNQNGILTVTSRQIAHDFGKEHKNVTRDIENIFNELNFEPVTERQDDLNKYFIPTEYKDNKGEMRKEYLLTRDGFSLLVMGFTGRQALHWKLKYIEAFNKMEETLKNNNFNIQPMQLQLMRETNKTLKFIVDKSIQDAFAKQIICKLYDIETPQSMSYIPKNNVKEFIERFCEFRQGSLVSVPVMYNSYGNYCIKNSYKVVSKIQFGKQLKQLRIEQIRIKGIRTWKNIKLLEG